MGRYILLRLAVIPPILLLANFAAFCYSYIARFVQLSQNPYGTSVETYPPLLPLYRDYVLRAARLDFGVLPSGVGDSVFEAVARAAGASLVLLGIVLFLSVGAGVLTGLLALDRESHRVRPWIIAFSSIGLAAPGFYLGAVSIFLVVWYVSRFAPGAEAPLPISGFGWDAHLILPVLALSIRPTMQIARVTAEMTASELERQYVINARAFGIPWHTVVFRHAFRNALAPVLLTMASSFRHLVGELILVEWLFSWPGLGNLLALTLIPPVIASVGGFAGAQTAFLDPFLLTLLVTTFALLFLGVDMLVSVLVRLVDPRLRIAGHGRELDLAD